MKITYTTIIHQAREKLNLSLSEYCVMDIINKMSNKKDYPYCILGKQAIADSIGLTRQAIINIISELEARKLIERNPENHLRATALWYETVELEMTVKKTDTPCKETLQTSVKKLDTPCKETLHNNNTIDGNEISKEIVSDTPNQGKAFLDFYFQEYQKEFKRKLIISGAKEMMLIKKLLKDIPRPELQALAIKFFKSPDKWIQDSGYTIGVFHSQINKLRSAGPTSLMEREKRLHYVPKGRPINV